MPIVTLSRMFGSGGSDVAARVAQMLGWTLLDNALVDEVAAKLGVSPAEVSAHEERVPTMAERLATALTLGSGEMLLPAAAVEAASMLGAEERIFEVTRRVIAEAVAKGPAVMVGRGAQMVLAERRDALHVYCYSSRDVLVRRVMDRLAIGRHEAEKLVDEKNHQREQYVKQHWKRSWRALENYHVCLNTGWLGIDGSAALIARLARERLVGS